MADTVLKRRVRARLDELGIDSFRRAYMRYRARKRNRGVLTLDYFHLVMNGFRRMNDKVARQLAEILELEPEEVKRWAEESELQSV